MLVNPLLKVAQEKKANTFGNLMCPILLRKDAYSLFESCNNEAFGSLPPHPLHGEISGKKIEINFCLELLHCKRDNANFSARK